MIQRFTLIHPVEGEFVISELAGWEQAVSGFDRHPDFHSLVETYKSSFSAYGFNGTEDGGRDLLLKWEGLYGPDAEVYLRVEQSDTDQADDFYEIVTVCLPIVTFNLKLDKGFTLDFGLETIGIWTKLLARYETPVDIQSTKNLDDSAVVAIAPVNVNLLPQKVFQQAKFNELVGYDFGSNYPVGTAIESEELPVGYFSIDLENLEISEIPTKLSLGNVSFDKVPTPLFIVDYAGVYHIDINLNFTNKRYYQYTDAHGTPGTGHSSEEKKVGPQGYLTVSNAFFMLVGDQIKYTVITPSIEVYIQFNNDDPIKINNVDHGPTVYPSGVTIHGGDYTSFTYVQDITLKAKDSIRIFGKVIGASGFGYGYENSLHFRTTLGWEGLNVLNMNQLVLLGQDNSLAVFPDQTGIAPYTIPATPPNGFDTHINISANTIYPATICPTFFLHDVFGGIIDRITGLPTAFHSPLLGSPDTKYKQYIGEGALWQYVNAKGLQIRNYTLAEKPFAQSLRDQWEGANNILNLSLRYDKLNGNDVIIIDRKEACYDDSDCSVYLSNVGTISRQYDQEFFYNQVEVGYQSWESEDVSGIDDPQSKQTRASRLKTIGKKLTLLSNFIAASLVWETTRRTTRLKSTDYKYDNNTFILAVDKSGSDYNPELDDNFSNVTGLLNEETRYNKKLSSARNFLRWINLISGGLQQYASSVLKFVSGEGNFAMSTTMYYNNDRESFGGQPLSEKQDIPVSSEYLFLPILYNITHHLTVDQYKAIQANRHLAIGISQTETDFTKFFIKSLQYTRATGEVTIEAWPKTFMEIVVPDNPDNEQEINTAYVEDDTFTHPPFN
jgi:hypothetical protein